MLIPVETPSTDDVNAAGMPKSRSPAELVPAPAANNRAEQHLALPSGRSLVVSGISGQEHLEIRSPEGAIELRIALTKDGPVLSLSGVRLEINSTDTVAVNCREFTVATTHGVALSSAGDVSVRAGGEIRTKSLGETHLDSSVLQLNSGDRSDYDDASLPPFELPTEVTIKNNEAGPDDDAAGCCGHGPHAH